MPATLKALLQGASPVIAPGAFNPLMAKIAEEAGFKAIYLSGGSLGYLKGVTEANLNLTEMIQTGIDMMSFCDLPLILDGAGGWGDPMHLRRTIQTAERAGFAGIEIEDQLLPKRAHHHAGIDHCIAIELMEAKVREAVAARRGDDFQIIARTNASRDHGIDEALRRAEAYKKAGADIIFVATGQEAELRRVAEVIEGPLMAMVWMPKAFSNADLHAMGYQLIVDPMTPLWAEYRALKEVYAALRDEIDLDYTRDGGGFAIQRAIHETIGLETLLDIERRTVEPS